MTRRRWLLLIGISLITLTLGIFSLQPTMASRSSHGPSAPPQSSPSPPEPQFKEGELLVKFSQNLSSNSKQAVHTSVGASVLKEFSFIGWQLVQLPQGTSVAQGISLYKEAAGVVAVEPNFAVQLAATPNDPNFGLQYGLQKIQAPAAWNTTTGSSNVVIAVLDTGVNYNHADLAANMWHNPGEIAGNGIDDDNNGYVDDVYGIDPSNNDSNPFDDVGHGTECAGVLGAVGNNSVGVAGVNWSVKIMALKIFNNTSTGYVSEVITAFDYVTMMKNRGVNVRATSNSWRWWFGQFSQSVKDSIDAAGDAGVANVFASGNDFTSENVCMPAGCRPNHSIDLDFEPTYGAAWDSPSIIAIASSNETDNLSVFAGIGRRSVDLAAPGENIWTTNIDGGYGPHSGTSMSTPFVAGAIGLLSAHDSSLSVASLKATLLNTVDVLTPFVDKTVSGGRLNVASALQASTVCTFTVVAENQTFAANAGTGRIDVSAATNCDFAGKTTSDFITIVSGAGAGDGWVDFAVAANTTETDRSGTISVAGQTIEVVQAGDTSEGCVELSPASENFSAAGGEGSFEVNGLEKCETVLDVASNDFWIFNILIGRNNVVSYAVAPNDGNARTGTIRVSQQTFTVTQESGCAFSFTPNAQSLQAVGGDSSVKVYAGNSACAWTPVSNASWLHVSYVLSGGNAGASAVGDGLVFFSADANNSGVDRSANIAIGDQNYTVSQGHCFYSFSPGQIFVIRNGGSSNFNLTTTSGCPWSVSTVSDWIHFTSATSGTGNATVSFTVDENLTAQERSTLIYIGEEYGSQAIINSSQFVSVVQDSHLPGKIAYSTNADGDYEIYVMNNDGSNQTRLTNNTAYDDGAAWSPDGLKIAFTSNRDGQLNIYAMNADGSNQTRLTTTNDSDVFPAWSPDGTQIAFQSFRDGTSQIYVMNADGSNQTRISNNTSYDYFPSWSPDGSKIAFSSSRTGSNQVFIMNANGSNQTQITSGGSNHAPSWSPNGRWITYMSNSGIMLYDTLFPSFLRQVTANSSDSSPKWSPDGSKIIFSGGSGDIYYVSFFDGSFPVQLTNSTAGESRPAWQPVPPKIAFTTTRDGGNYEIYLMNPNGSNQTNLTNNAGTDTTPTWSPDGMKVAFASTRSGSLAQDIYVVNADGSNPVNLTYSGDSDVYPAWSPDGSKIAFAAYRDGNSEVYVMNADGTNQVRLTNNSAYDSYPTWSPDGAKIAFTSSRDGTNQIYVMNADGSNQTRLTNNSSNDHFAAWSPNGKKIAFASTRTGSFQIYLMNVDGSNQTQLTTGSGTYPQWSQADGSKIVFTSGQTNNEIYVMNADGTNQVNLTNNSANDYGPVWRRQ